MRIWNEVYRPKTLEGMILPPEHLEAFKTYMTNGLPNVIFYGSPGTGKTTTALIFINQSGSEFKRMNGSDTRGIDVVREEIKNFVQTKSFNQKPKIVFYDEAEALTPDAFKALKEMTERFQTRVSFIFCTNHLYKFPEAIRSRCTLFEFKKPTKEETIRFLKNVLENESVRYSPEDLDTVYKSCAGDLRRSLNFLQRYSMSGKLELPQETYGEILKLVKGGTLTDLKRYFAGHSVDFDGLYRFLFERTDDPTKAVLLAKYAYQDALCVDKEINFVGFVAEYQKLNTK